MRTTSSIYTVPEHFLERLREVFGNRLRIRWSAQRRAWLIEHKLPPEAAPVPPLFFDAARDDHLQAADGYEGVMLIQPGDRMDCEFCHLPLKVPLKEIKEIGCRYCLERGRDARFMVCYWPLDETLIDHLKSIDPERQGAKETRKRLRDDVQVANEAHVVRAERRGEAERTAAGKYYFPYIFQIQSTGWTPQTGAMWSR